MRSVKWVWMTVSVICLAGCGDSGPERIGASGEIKYNGELIKDGEIAFFPEPGTEAPPTSAPVVNGKYQLAAKWALIPGTYKVAIRSYKVAPQSATLPGSTLDRPPPIGGIEVKEQLLPEKFNTKSTIETLTVKSKQGAVKKDYDLRD